MMDLAMITVRREPVYAYPTLLSLFTAGGFPGPAHLFVGSDDATYLEHLEGDPRFVVHEMPSEFWSEARGWDIHRRFSLNYWRALDWASHRGRGLCLCEDDLRFAEGFWGHLAEAVEELDREVGRYVLAIYSAYDLGSDPSMARGRHYTEYPAEMFFGTQAIYYPPTVLAEQAEHLLVNGVEVRTAPGDLIVRELCLKRRYLFATRPSLAQHIGQASTGLGYFHRSPTFQAASTGAPFSTSPAP